MDLPREKEHLRHISYDSVIFGFSRGKLKVLVVKHRNTDLYALPGGFVRHSESLDEAVRRGLKERTGLTDIYLEQFHVFGDRERSGPEVMKAFLRANGIDPEPDHFMLDRFISVGYYALVDHEKVEPQPDPLSDYIGWYEPDHLPGLMLDHDRIVKKALEALKSNLDHKLLGSNLLPERFTMKELQLVHEAILGEKLSRTNFQRKMLALEILQRHEKKYSGGAHKAPYLYSFID